MRNNRLATTGWRFGVLLLGAVLTAVGGCASAPRAPISVERLAWEDITEDATARMLRTDETYDQVERVPSKISGWALDLERSSPGPPNSAILFYGVQPVVYTINFADADGRLISPVSLEELLEAIAFADGRIDLPWDRDVLRPYDELVDVLRATDRVVLFEHEQVDGALLDMDGETLPDSSVVMIWDNAGVHSYGLAREWDGLRQFKSIVRACVQAASPQE